MPEKLPKLPEGFFEEMKNLDFHTIALEVCRHLLGEIIAEEALKKIVNKAVNFDAPLISLDQDLHILELFHGPTLAFKDFGARFMAQLMSYLTKEEKEALTILVATSGDTGGAVAAGFYQTPGIEVIILYPQGRVSKLQEKQLTTLGENITALEVEGSFDECQALVKAAFLDPELNHLYRLTSANSINIARLIPQSFYYFRAIQQLEDSDRPIAFCVPSGNFGNLTAGLMASQMGLPTDHFIAATNVNDVVPQFLQTGEFHPRPSLPTLSNAMDVGNPSNFARMQDLFHSDWNLIRNRISGYSYSDAQTVEGIREVFRKYSYVIDPHGAIGYLAAKEFREENPDYQVVVLETAHPSKFADPVKKATGKEVEIPERLAVLADKEKVSTLISSDFKDFQGWMKKRKGKY